MAKSRNIVYSTNPDWQPDADEEMTEVPAPARQNVKIQREKKGRGGKTVTVIRGLQGDIKSLQKELQKLCATGGSLKQDQIEIQGDHGPRICDYLKQKGYNARLAGGY